MTQEELLAKIKAEIERRKVDYLNRSYTFVPKAMQDLLDFLSTLESENPINQEGLENEISHWFDCLDDKYCMLVEQFSIQDIKDTARHFAKWGAEHLKK